MSFDWSYNVTWWPLRAAVVAKLNPAGPAPVIKKKIDVKTKKKVDIDNSRTELW